MSPQPLTSDSEILKHYSKTLVMPLATLFSRCEISLRAALDIKLLRVEWFRCMDNVFSCTASDPLQL